MADITFLVNNYWPSVGGAQTHVQRIAQGLSEQFGHRVSVITTDALLAPTAPDPGRIATTSERVGGVHVERVAVARRTQRAVRFVRRAAKRSGWYKPRRNSAFTVGPLGLGWLGAARRAGRTSDVVIAVTFPTLTLLAGDLATRRSPAAFVVMPLLHASDEPPRPWSLRVLRRADACSASTTFERDWLIDHGVDPIRITILPPGCDPQLHPDIDSSTARGVLGLPDRPTVGYFGRLSPTKGVDDVLAVAPSLWERFGDLTILVAGSRTAWTGIDDLIRGLSSDRQDRLVFMDGFDERDKPMLFAACDVIAFPSKEESFGMVTLEAWSARRPVVVADLPAVRTVVRDGVDGLVVPVSDRQALAEAIGALVDDPALAATLGASGRRRVEEEFRWDDIVRGWHQVVESLAVEGRR